MPLFLYSYHKEMQDLARSERSCLSVSILLFVCVSWSTALSSREAIARSVRCCWLPATEESPPLTKDTQIQVCDYVLLICVLLFHFFLIFSLTQKRHGGWGFDCPLQSDSCQQREKRMNHRLGVWCQQEIPERDNWAYRAHETHVSDILFFSLFSHLVACPSAIFS